MRPFLVLILLAPAIGSSQVLTAMKILGGSANDAASVVATDAQGNVFVAGTTTSSDFPLVKPIYSRLLEPALRVATDGQTFAASSLSAETVYSMAASSDGRTLLAGTTNGISRSTDGGASWTASQTTISGQTLALAIDPTNSARAYAVVAMASSSLFYRSADGGVTWQTTSVAVGYGRVGSSRIAVDPVTPSTLYAFFSNGYNRSTDGGLTWSQMLVPDARASNGQGVPFALAIAPSQPRTIYAITANTTFVKSLDSGATWQTLPAFASTLNPNGIAVDPNDPNVVWFNNGVALQRTTDGGAMAQSVLSMQTYAWSSIAIDPHDSTRIFATDSLHVYASLNNGASWTSVATGHSQAVLATPSAVWAAAAATPTLFLAKLDPSLTQVLFSTYIGPVQSDTINLAVDGSGNPLITGVAYSGDYPATANAWQNGFSSATAGFATKVKADGSSLLYSTFLSGITPKGAAFDAAGNAVVAASAQASQTFPAGPCTRQPLAGSSLIPQMSTHGFLLKLSADGSAPLWQTYLGGSCGDSANAVQLDSSGNAIVTGSTDSVDFPVTANATTGAFPGSTSSGFLAKLSADGSRLLYATYFGGGDNTSGNALALDGSGNVYVGGQTLGKASPGALSPPTQPGCEPIISIGPGGYNSYEYADGFVMKLGLNGSPATFIALIGGSCNTAVASLSLDSAGHIWVAGSTQSENFPTVAPIGAFGPGNGGFLSELDSTGSSLLFSTLTGGGQAISDGRLGAYLAGLSTNQTKSGLTSALAAHIDGGQIVPLSVDSIQSPGTQPTLAPPVFVGPSVAPGQLVLLNGRAIGPSTRVSAQLTAAAQFPVTLAGVQVLFDGNPAPLVYAQADQMECQAPFALDGASATNIQVVVNGQTSNTFAAAVVAQNVFLLGVVNADGTLNSAANPAKAGSVVALYVNGFGQTTPPGVDGGLNPNGAGVPRNMPTVFLNGAVVQPLFLGTAPGESTAVSQVNIAVPGPASGNADYVGISGIGSLNQASAMVYVK